MIRFAALVAVIVHIATAKPLEGQEQALPIPAEWSTHYAWLLLANPDYQPSSQSADSALTMAHIQYQLRLYAKGSAIVAGGFAPVPGDPVVGLTILRASSLEEARAIANADPAVDAGRLLAKVREWWVPSEQMP